RQGATVDQGMIVSLFPVNAIWVNSYRVMPMALFKGEWVAMGEGKDHKKYLPLTHVENYVPLCFGIMYILLGLSFYFCK
ncbi:RipA family octameric membrane protein, partial [Aeromonas sp. QDB22]|uniref:RipA family octameric membrane protein n=1 Tax=Aeromonas sp. QDB22 TaxID=2989834 RepID=UPI0022E82F57